MVAVAGSVFVLSSLNCESSEFSLGFRRLKNFYNISYPRPIMRILPSSRVSKPVGERKVIRKEELKNKTA